MPRASRDEAGTSQPAPSHEWMLANERFCALLERHLQKYSALPAKYPQLREAYFHDLAGRT